MSALNALVLGFALGAASSAVGGLLSYWFGLRRIDGPSAVPLVYLFLSVLMLGLVGALSLVFGAFSGSVVQALLTGIGVIFGFSTVFALLLFSWIKFGDKN